MKEKAQLEKTIETLRENSERQVRVFLTQTVVLKIMFIYHCTETS